MEIVVAIASAVVSTICFFFYYRIEGKMEQYRRRYGTREKFGGGHGVTRWGITLGVCFILGLLALIAAIVALLVHLIC